MLKHTNSYFAYQGCPKVWHVFAFGRLSAPVSYITSKTFKSNFKLGGKKVQMQSILPVAIATNGSNA